MFPEMQDAAALLKQLERGELKLSEDFDEAAERDSGWHDDEGMDNPDTVKRWRQFQQRRNESHHRAQANQFAEGERGYREKALQENGTFDDWMKAEACAVQSQAHADLASQPDSER